MKKNVDNDLFFEEYFKKHPACVSPQTHKAGCQAQRDCLPTGILTGLDDKDKPLQNETI